MKSFLVIVVATIWVIPSLMFGAPLDLSELYIDGVAGSNIIQNNKAHEPFNLKIDPGMIIGIAMGYKFDSWRSEVELAYRHNNFQEGRALAPDVYLDTGDLAKYSLFANVFYDCNLIF